MITSATTTSTTTKMIEKIIVHGGIFHADDIFCVALARILNPDCEVDRVFKIPDGVDVNAVTGTIVADIGDGVFDHHHGELTIREDGCPKAAFGLMWAHYGHALCDGGLAWSIVDNTLVRHIDAHDNGFDMGNPLSVVLSTFNPTWDEKVDRMTQFMTAVGVAKTLLERAIESANSTVRAIRIADEYLEVAHDHIMIMDKFVPWEEFLKNNDTDRSIWFVIFPSLRGGWSLQSVDSAAYPLPAEWVETLPEGLTFCHKARFIAAAIDKETAVKYGDIAVDTLLSPIM